MVVENSMESHKKTDQLVNTSFLSQFMTNAVFNNNSSVPHKKKSPPSNTAINLS